MQLSPELFFKSLRAFAHVLPWGQGALERCR